MTIRLTRSMSAWGTPGFNDTLKREIEQLDVDQLPLQQGLSHGNYVLDNERRAMIIAVSETAGSIRAKVGVFYSGILAGCSCADDPTPNSELDEYCELQLDIDRATGETQVTLLPE